MCHFAAFFLRGNLEKKDIYPHSFRRGGATWFFSLHHSYDKVMSHGRWVQPSSAKVYVGEAMADTVEGILPAAEQRKLEAIYPLLQASLQGLL